MYLFCSEVHIIKIHERPVFSYEMNSKIYYYITDALTESFKSFLNYTITSMATAVFYLMFAKGPTGS